MIFILSTNRLFLLATFYCIDVCKTEDSLYFCNKKNRNAKHEKNELGNSKKTYKNRKPD